MSDSVKGFGATSDGSIQIHLANFRLHFLDHIELRSEGEFQKVTRYTTLFCMHVMRVVLEYYVEDIMNDVKAGVLQDISQEQDEGQVNFRKRQLDL